MSDEKLFTFALIVVLGCFLIFLGWRLHEVGQAGVAGCKVVSCR